MASRDILKLQKEIQNANQWGFRNIISNKGENISLLISIST